MRRLALIRQGMSKFSRRAVQLLMLVVVITVLVVKAQSIIFSQKEGLFPSAFPH